ncbi:MAG: imidazole glycerol phosphate synthase subunit HisH [Alphaproteobacteria bacterium]|nr:imidazole glycerol phosphate synthase subunit HisH [Alphaproteobacteria bacterium]
MQTVAIIDYGSGNLRSAAKAFERMAVESELARTITVTADADVVAVADRVVLPGVGAFADCHRGVSEPAGLRAALQTAVIDKARPFLGICVGMQLMATRGLEHGETPGFDWIAGDVVAIKPSSPDLKIPHMGWNELNIVDATHPVLDGLAPNGAGPHAYFVHSYHLDAAERRDVLATTDYGGPITAMVGRDNMVGTQFHPEKSQATGLRLIANFLDWSP